MQRLLLFCLASIYLNLAKAQQFNIVPKPTGVMYELGHLDINKQLAKVKGLLNKKSGTDGKPFFIDNIDKKPLYVWLIPNKNLNEAYIITINKNGISITASEISQQYAKATLNQIIEQFPDGKIPCATITDKPRFSYRGMHLDVGRHFQPVSYIKKYIDYLARYKYNTFHWHLTEDQGWRIEIKKYPKLTSVGGYRNGTITGRYPGTGNTNEKYGGYYTQEQIKDIVKYATERNITVIPEIELPGHSSAAIAAYPELSCFPNEPTKIPNEHVSAASKNSTGKLVQETWGVFEDVFCPTEYTFNFMQDVLDEVMQLFPSQYIHIGGDECPKESWKRSEFCQQFIKDNNLKDEHGLQSYFIQRIEKYINRKGKNIIGWDEILEGGLAPNATVMSWRGEAGGIEAAKQNHNVIMTPGSYCYLDHSQSRDEDSVTIGGYTTVEKVYSYNPVPRELNATQAKYVLGAQGNVWTEYMSNPRKIEYQIFPRMIALSEVLWSDTAGRNWEEFEPRLVREMAQLKARKINYSAALFDFEIKVMESSTLGKVDLIFSSKDKTKKFVQRIEDPKYEYPIVSKDSIVESPITISNSQAVTLDYYNSTNTKSKSITFSFNKATAQKINLAKPPSTRYAGNGGAFGLVNGVKSERGINSTEWLGFGEGGDCDATIDLGKLQTISEVKVHTLDQQGSWIYLPSAIEIYTSNDGTNYTAITSKTMQQKDTARAEYFISNFTATQARYIRVLIKNFGNIPTGKQGAGHKAWLFVDEIGVE